MDRRYLAALIAGLSGLACGTTVKTQPQATARQTCRAEDGLVLSARYWLSLPDGPADTIGKDPGFFAELPKLPEKAIATVTDEPTCRAIAAQLAKARGDSSSFPVSVLRFGPTRYLAWDLVEPPGARPAIFVTYYVLDEQLHVLSKVST